MNIYLVIFQNEKEDKLSDGSDKSEKSEKTKMRLRRLEKTLLKIAEQQSLDSEDGPVSVKKL